MAKPSWTRRATAAVLSRTALALLCAPLGAFAGGLLGAFAVVATTGPLGTPWQFLAFTVGIWIVLLPLAPVAAFPVAAVGVPLHLLLAASGQRHWPSYGLAGVAAGTLFPVVRATLRGIEQTPLAWLLDCVSCGAAGLGAALAFWAVLRPDQQAAVRKANSP